MIIVWSSWHGRGKRGMGCKNLLTLLQAHHLFVDSISPIDKQAKYEYGINVFVVRSFGRSFIHFIEFVSSFVRLLCLFDYRTISARERQSKRVTEQERESDNARERERERTDPAQRAHANVAFLIATITIIIIAQAHDSPY